MPTPDRIEQRVATNLYHFRGNYCQILLLMCFLPFLNASLLFYVVVFGLIFLFLRAQDQDWELELGPVPLSKDQVMFYFVMAGLASAVYIMWMRVQNLIKTLALAIILVILHACVRKRPQ